MGAEVLLFRMIAQPGQHRAVTVNGVDVIDQAFAEIEHLDQVLVLHRRVEFLLQLAGNHLDHLEVPQIVMDVVEQQFEQHIQWRVQRLALAEPAEGRLVGGDHQQAIRAKQQAAGRHFEGQAVGAGVIVRSLPDQEEVVRMKLDTRHLVRVERRGQGMIIQLEMTVQQVPFGGVGIAEQHHLGVQPFDRVQRAVGQLITFDHGPLTRPGRDALAPGA